MIAMVVVARMVIVSMIVVARMVIVTVIDVTVVMVVRCVQLRFHLFNLGEQRTTARGPIQIQGLRFGFRFLPTHQTRRPR